MSLLEDFTSILEGGDPTLKSWFMIQSCFWPIFCFFFYLLFASKIGPAIMKNKMPFELRTPMIVYNFFVVSLYVISLSGISYYTAAYSLYYQACENIRVIYPSPEYNMAGYVYILYMVKYVEYLDTVFFVLRKKNHLITNLHVIHHASLPLLAWWCMRTEFSGYQLIPGYINGVVHIIMYTYYGLAAMGPSIQKYLWWKEYLTMLQMAQFIIVLLFSTVIVPLSGCRVSRYGIILNVIFCILFFVLFFNFYLKTYKGLNSKGNITGLRKDNGENASDLTHENVEHLKEN